MTSEIPNPKFATPRERLRGRLDSLMETPAGRDAIRTLDGWLIGRLLELQFDEQIYIYELLAALWGIDAGDAANELRGAARALTLRFAADKSPAMDPA